MSNNITTTFSTHFLNNNVKDYALYVIRTRAVPSLMDGMRIGARKILYAGISQTFKKYLKADSIRKDIKMPNMIGDVFHLEFHHGDASLKNTIEQLGSKHVLKYAPLAIVGQIPTLRKKDVNTAARYLHVRNTDYLRWFTQDMNLLNYLEEDGTAIEPSFFLPLIPIQLLYRTNSPGYGVGYRGFSYTLQDVINTVMQTIIMGTSNTIDAIRLKPEIYGIDPEKIIYNENKQTWFNVGDYNLDFVNDIVTITDLPYNVTYDSYKEYLFELEERGYITKFINHTRENKTNIEIRFAKGRLTSLYNSGKFKFYTKLKLFSKIPKNNLNYIDVNGNLISFDNEYDMIDKFVSRRLEFYQQRKTKLIDDLLNKLDTLEDLRKFIQLVVEDKLIINKRSIVDIKKDCDKFEVSYNGLDLKVSKFTLDEIEKINQQIIEIKNELEYIKATSIQTMYINDLIDFQQEYAGVHEVDNSGNVDKAIGPWLDNGYEKFDFDEIPKSKFRKQAVRKTTISL